VPLLYHRGYGWLGSAVDVPPGSFWWCNPPFSKVKDFLEKARLEYQRGNHGFFLVPSNQETKWFREYITATNLRRLVWPSRIKFIDPDTKLPGKGNTVASVIVAFDDEPLPRIKEQPWVMSC